MVTMQPDELVRYYEHYLGYLGDPESAYEDSMNILIARDDIEDCWTELDEDQRTRVLELDIVLAGKHGTVAEVLPTRVAHDRRRWWWFLHEGPQVKEQAEAASTR